MKRVAQWGVTALFLPFIQIQNLYRYSQTRGTRSARIALIVSFIPIILLTFVVWVAAWAFVVAALRHLLSI